MELGGILQPEWSKLNSTSAQTFLAPSSFPVTSTPPTLLYKGGCPFMGSSSLVLPSIRSITILHTADLSPNQMGVAMMKISAALISSKIRGQSSPSPSSDVFPKATLKSITRITLVVTPDSAYNSVALSIKASVLETSGDFLSVQLSITAFKDIMVWLSFKVYRILKARIPRFPQLGRWPSV